MCPTSGGTNSPESRRAEMELRGFFLIDSLLAPRPPAEPPAPPEAPPQPRSISFLIRDILADHRSGSDPGQPEPRAEPFRTGPDGDREPASSSDPAGGPAGVRSKKQRKARTAFSEQQLNKLETSFQNHKYLSVQARMDLAASLQLSDTQVKTWYQNRRTKWKRQSAAGLELLAAAGRMFLPHHFLCRPAPPTPDHFLCGGHAHQLTAPPLLTHILTRSDLC